MSDRKEGWNPVPASSTSKDFPRTWTSELHNSGSGSSDLTKDSRRSVNAWIMKLIYGVINDLK